MYTSFDITSHNRANWVKTGGMTFQASSVIVLGVKEDLPEFAGVRDVYVVSTHTILLYTRLLQTLEFCRHCHAYAICRFSCFKLVSPKDVYTHSLLYIRHLRADGCNKLVIVLKYHICDSVWWYVQVCQMFHYVNLLCYSH